MNNTDKRFSTDEVIERIEAGVKRLSEAAQEQRRILEERANQNPWVAKLKSGELKKELDTRFEELRIQVLGKVGLATRDELDKLAKKLTNLSKRVADLTNKTAA